MYRYKRESKNENKWCWSKIFKGKI
jgi:hypothetical protein